MTMNKPRFKSAKLVKHNDHATGEGYIWEGMDTFGESQVLSCREGYTLAHDLLEHFTLRDIGCPNFGVRDECMAIGAIWFVRGSLGDIRRDRVQTKSAEEIFSYDCVSLLIDVLRYGQTIRCPRTTRHDDIEEHIDIILKHAHDMLVREIADHSKQQDEPWTDEEKDAFLQDFLRFYRAYFRIGYRRAVKRFHNNEVAAHALFWNMAEAIDKEVDFDGYSEYRVRYNLDTRKVTVEEIYE